MVSKQGNLTGAVINGIRLDFPQHAADIDAHMADAYMTLRVGNYYAGGITEGSGATMTANRLYANPVFVARTMTFDRIAIDVTTGSAGAARLGIYNDDGTGLPGSLVSDLGTVDTTSTALVAITISQQLTKGWYWLAAVFDATPSITKEQLTYIVAPLGLNATTFSIQVCGFKAHTYGSLPDPYGTMTTFVGVAGTHPFIAIRVLSLD